MPQTLVTREDVEAARVALEGVVRRTPVEPSRVLARSAGGPVSLKCENLQRTGSFKIRGAYRRIQRLTDDERARGVVAASAGNHAQGVALAAGLLGTHATVFMPAGAPLPKLAATRGYGADVELVDTFDATLTAAQEFAARTGAVLIHPFDHPDIVAGQGTVALEILEQVPDVATVVVCTGGGGLVAGIAAALAGTGVSVVGAQAEALAAWPPSLEAGAPVTVTGATIADGIAVPRPGELTFAQVSAQVDEVVTVSEEALSRAVLQCLERGKLLVEPAGAAAVAALAEYPGRWRAPVVAVLSGGNVDPLMLDEIVRRGMAAAGRYAHLRVRLPDRPGYLADLLARVGRLGGNVVDVEHRRLEVSADLGPLALGSVEVALTLEARGNDHRAAMVDALREAGYAVAEGTVEPGTPGTQGE
ncbi:threonine ammonia-lyase [Actinomycetospora endophytica]|uniref:L-threonine dehydratase catabolic TdcB n=1 Tax=Actinomycetospora endophytica TaxID=2291215 RepID=A0ABS8P7K7_9PSEU|nr:threonine ammonia-lyase [Actinomycetospora endophytica]MCD2194250.1 threonine ammonia-lyase [Actinomycetospora endophytica]